MTWCEHPRVEIHRVWRQLPCRLRLQRHILQVRLVLHDAIKAMHTEATYDFDFNIFFLWCAQANKKSGSLLRSIAEI